MTLMSQRAVHVTTVLANAAIPLLLAPPRARRTPFLFRVVSFNIDWGLNLADWHADLAALIPHADVIELQEAKFLDLATALAHLDPGVWVVVQDTSHPDRMGVAIAWRRSVFGTKAVSARYVLGAAHGHDVILNRWFCRVALRSVARPDVVIPFLDCHRPPVRDSNLWPAFDHVAQRISLHNPRRREVLACDLNEALVHDPLGLRAQGYRVVGHRIDGVYFKGLRLVDVAVGPKLHSDHRATIATFAA